MYNCVYSTHGIQRRQVTMGEESDVESRSEEIEAVVPHPVQTIQVINGVIKVLYNYKRAVTYKDISTACSIHPSNVSQALSGASDIGLTRSSGRGLYILSEEGKNYAMLLQFGKEEEAKVLLRKIIINNPLWTEVLTFLNATKGQERDPLDLVMQVERFSGKQWKPSMRSRVENGLTSILEFAGFIIKQGSKIVPVGERVDFAAFADAEMASAIEKIANNRTSQPIVEKENKTGKGFAQLSSDNYIFQIKEDLDSIQFSESQFKTWIEFLKKKLIREKQEAQQSEGVPNQ
jgi:hypothetical protein